MMRLKSSLFVPILLLILTLGITGAGFAQSARLPETILDAKTIQAILNEISGQLAFNNEVMMAGYERIRTQKEFETNFHESEYLTAKLREYGLDEVRLEDLGQKDVKGGGWWSGLDAELWMVDPELRRLSTLAEHPALMARLCDAGEWQGELVFIDKRDLPDLANRDFTGKIILTSEHLSSVTPAFKKGALGAITYYSHARPAEDPFQVCYDMGFRKGRIKEKVFGFVIWQRLGEELRDMILTGRKVVIKAKAESGTFPSKLDTIFATIKGTNPDKKGLLFTAHLFERPAKQGANDNVSGCVTLSEIARTITKLIKDGRIPRPERSIHFLMGEEGGSTMGFFKKYPEMADKILGVINMDMVGENLDLNGAFFGIETPTLNKATYLEAVIKNFAEYVFQGNLEKHSDGVRTLWMTTPAPIVEKNGSRQPFRYLVNNYEGGSDHGTFIEADADIPAFSFNVWPDIWYHTDKDRPDKSDPTQLKRVAFIGAASALAVCSGDASDRERLIRIAWQDRTAFVGKALDRGIREIGSLSKADGGAALRNAENYIDQAVDIALSSMKKSGDLAGGNPKLTAYLQSVTANLERLRPIYLSQVRDSYRMTAALKGFAAETAKPAADEKLMKTIVPEKSKPIAVGDMPPFMAYGNVLKDWTPEEQARFYENAGFDYLMRFHFYVNGRDSLYKIWNLLNFEMKPMPAADFLKLYKGFQSAGLIKKNG